MAEASVVIVGGGASGLSAAGALKQQGIDSVVLEQDAQVGGTWARRYDRLHLHTVRGFSGLAHFGIPRRYPKYLSRDQFVEYLREYVDHFGLKVVNGATVTAISSDPQKSRWKATTSNGQTWSSRAVVIATGQYRRPIDPHWPRTLDFRGQLSHSVGYSNAKSFVGKRVLVVGSGNSGAEIAADIAENGGKFVALSIRTPPMIVPRDPFGMPVQRTGIILSLLPPAVADRLGRLTARITLGDLTKYKIPQPAWGPYSAKRIPLIDVGFVSAVKRGLLHIRPGVERLTPAGAVYADGVEESFDSIVAAIGFETGLARLIDGNGVLDDVAEPIAASGEPTSRPGLYFIGFVHSLRGHLFEANRASKRLAGNVFTYLRRAADSGP
ncbi:MAG: flavin-containing monooxygenase [Gemmatimonadaceae bacterium]